MRMRFFHQGILLPILERLRARPLPVILFTVFVDLIGYGIVLPIEPLLLADPSSKYYLIPQGLTVSDGYIILGLLIGTYSIAQFLATPIIGQASDQRGRKGLLLFSLAGIGFSYLMFVAGISLRSIPLLFVARIIMGVTGGDVAIVQAATADISKPEDRVKNFALVGAAFGLGFVIGPVLGGILSDSTLIGWFDATTPFWFAAGLSTANIVSVYILFPETLKTLKGGARIVLRRALLDIIHAFSIGELKILYASVLLFYAGFAFFATFASVFLINKFGFTQTGIGVFFALVGAWITISQVFVTGRLSRRLTEYQVLKFSLLSMGVLLLLFNIPTQGWELYVLVPFFSTLIGLAFANSVSIVSRSVGPDIQGEVLGINASVRSLGMGIPPLLSGFIAAGLTPETPIVVSGAVTLLAGIVFVVFYKPTPDQRSMKERKAMTNKPEVNVA